MNIFLRIDFNNLPCSKTVQHFFLFFEEILLIKKLATKEIFALNVERGFAKLKIRITNCALKTSKIA